MSPAVAPPIFEGFPAPGASGPGHPHDRGDTEKDVPNTASQKKRLRQSRLRRAKNRELRSEVRTRTKTLLAMESADGADAALSELYTALDRAARKRVIAPNAASRQKARAARHVHALKDA